MNTAVDTPYDVVHYRSEPNPVAHPGRLAAIGRLHGLRTADMSRARILELGCGDGGHLLPLAAIYPQAEFTGCDLARTAIDIARRRAGAAALGNVRFHVADVRALPPALGRFDLVVSHGLYSWIPVDARTALLAACAACLSDEGIAFVSYNALPGGHLRRMVRDILLFHTAGLDDPRAQLTEARALARLLTNDGDREDASNAALRYEMRQIVERSDQALCHDDLAPHQHPVYFTEFVTEAAAHGLHFLAEAEYHTMTDTGLSPGTRAALAGMEPLAREQYRDFLRCRRFRQTLLCHTGHGVLAAPDKGAIDGLFASAPLTHVRRIASDDRPQPGPAPELPVEQPVRALFEAVYSSAPHALSFAEACAAFAAGGGDRDCVDAVRTILLEGFQAGWLQLSTEPSSVARRVAPRPCASAYARMLAAEGEIVVNGQLLSIRLDDAKARALYAQLDGSRDLDGLMHELVAMGFADATREWVEACLARLLQLGLLVA